MCPHLSTLVTIEDSGRIDTRGVLGRSILLDLLRLGWGPRFQCDSRP